MGRKGSWFSSVKKALSPSSKEKKSKKSNKSKKKCLGNEKPSVSDSPNHETIEICNPHPLPSLEVVENEQTELAYSVAQPTAAAVPQTTVPRFTGKSKEEVAAIKVQTAFRGYLARRALRALRGLVRLKSLVDGPTVKRQSANTLKCMQTLSRVHSQIQSRRIRMSEDNRALQKQLLQKRATELENLRMGEDWDDSLQSKEKIEANMLHKFEAAMRRERALAYSYTHQQTMKKSAKSNNLLFMDPTNPQWGWSWLERWENAQTTSQLKDLKSASPSTGVGEITKSFTRHQLNSDDTTPSSPVSQKPPSARKSNQTSPKVSQDDDDSRSLFSVQSERNRRHTIGGSSVKDDESLGSSPAGPSYMAATKSAKAKSRLPSPLGLMENNGHNTLIERGSAKKRLSFAPSPARPRRHSGPPKVETAGSIVGNDVLIN